MNNLYPVASISEIPLGHSRCVEVSGKIIAVFHTAEGWFAVDERCSHRGGPLSEGVQHKGRISCPWHNAQFELATGRCLSSPKLSSVKTYRVVLKEEVIQIEITE